MRASNEGQQEAWDQAVEEGLLTGNEQQEWIVTPDDRLCPECEPFDGCRRRLDGTFRSGWYRKRWTAAASAMPMHAGFEARESEMQDSLN
jgi:hypothetical protein